MKQSKYYFGGLLALLVFFSLNNVTRAQSQGSVKVLDAKAREQLALRIKKNYSIIIDTYRKDIDAYEVRMEAEPDNGPNTTTREWLLKGIDNGMSINEIKRNPSRLIGSYFKLKKDLWLLSDEEIAQRLAKNSKKK